MFLRQFRKHIFHHKILVLAHCIKLKLSTNHGYHLLVSFQLILIGCWTIDVSRTASYEITLVCLSVCPSVRMSVTTFSQDWIISFFLILYMMIAMISSDWRSQIFGKKNWRPETGPNEPKSGPKLVFLPFSQVYSLVFLEITYNDSLQQSITWGKAHKKNWESKFGSKRAKIRPKISFSPFSQVWFISFPWNYIQ